MVVAIVATKKVLDKKFYTGVRVLHFCTGNLCINPCFLALSLVSVYLLITAQVWTSTGWKSFARNFGNGGAGPLTSPYIPALPPAHSRGVMSDSRGVSGQANGVVAMWLFRVL